MIINTVGKIILKNGQKVYKRFGAAVVLKIKLGTAAFANIVNNATTTEEGFVPDARVVAQQQETISALQEQVDSLNSAMNFVLYRATIRGTTNSAGNITLNKPNSNRLVWLLSVFCEQGQGYAALPYYTDFWWCKIIMSNSNGVISPVESTDVTLQCLWLELK